MRNSRDGQRGRREMRLRSGKPASEGNRDLIRFRRNRELMARESVGVALWIGLSAMMILLTRTMHRVAQTHLADQESWIRLGLPALPILGALGTLWRASASLREWLDIRREQREVLARLRSGAGE
jgi:hypothetical protein